GGGGRDFRGPAGGFPAPPGVRGPPRAVGLVPGGEDAEQVTDGADAHGEPRVGEVRAELAAGWTAMVAM
ncbi:hypothetical protein, partial [Nocardia brasiliensis]|uniref:hypothetical protein n=1 Tax=Nocardia brasiliensis TaxID=37326 RepID=UPI0024563FDD